MVYSDLHRNTESVGKGQDFGIGSILVSFCSPFIVNQVCKGFGCMQVNSLCVEYKKQNALAQMQSQNRLLTKDDLAFRPLYHALCALA